MFEIVLSETQNFPKKIIIMEEEKKTMKNRRIWEFLTPLAPSRLRKKEIRKKEKENFRFKFQTMFTAK